MIENGDWIVKLGFDDSEVKKGFKALGKSAERQAAKEARAERKRLHDSHIQAFSQNEKLQKRIEISKNRAHLKDQRVREQWAKQHERDLLRKTALEKKSIQDSHVKAFSENQRLQKNISESKTKAALKDQRVREQWNKQELLSSKRLAKEKAKAQVQVEKEWAKRRVDAVKRITSGVGGPGSSLSDMRSYYRALERESERSARKMASTSAAFDPRDRQRTLFRMSGTGRFKIENNKSLLGGQFAEFKSQQAMIHSAISGATTPEQLRNLRQAQLELNQAVNQAIVVGRKNANTMNAQKMAANSLRQSLMHLAKSWASVFAIIGGTTAFYRVGKEFDSLKASLLAGSGNAELAAKNFQFLKDVSMDLGTDVTEGARGFNKLSIAMKSAGFEQEQIQETYLAVAESARAFSLDTQRQGLVFLAISQMAAKGRVSMEELQRQLGDNLPTAMDAMAKAYSEMIGKTVSRGELIELVSQGKVMSKDVLPGFTRELRKAAREGGALAAAMNKVQAAEGRARNMLTIMVDESFQKSAPLFSSAWKDVLDILQDLKPAIMVFGRVFGLAFKTVTATLKQLTPVIKLISSGVEQFLFSMDAFVSLSGKAAAKGKQTFNAWERAGLGLLSVLYMIMGVSSAIIDTIRVVNDWLEPDKTDNKFEEYAKSTVKWLIGLTTIGITLGWIGKKLAWMLTPIKWLLKATGVLSTSTGTASTGVSNMAKTGAGTLGRTAATRVPILGIGLMAGMEAYNIKSDLEQGPWYQAWLKSVGRTSNMFGGSLIPNMPGGNAYQMIKPLLDSMNREIVVNNTVTLDGKAISKETSRYAIDAQRNQLLLEAGL